MIHSGNNNNIFFSLPMRYKRKKKTSGIKRNLKRNLNLGGRALTQSG